MNRPAMTAYDVREMSFQNVVDNVLKPAGVKVGGFPEEIFESLSAEESETLICNICYMIVSDCRQCSNKHRFCRSCILAWSMTYGENALKCPFCRCDQLEYDENLEVSALVSEKRVVCPEEGCGFKSPLRVFLMHNHGRLKYSNADVDFGSIRRPTLTRLMFAPNASFVLDRSAGATSMRDQLLQGRMMINQMMLLMHLEAQLRAQAVAAYTLAEDHDPSVRVRRLDDVLALNEQLNEVGSMLSTLLSVPLQQASAASATARRQTGVINDDDDDDDDEIGKVAATEAAADRMAIDSASNYTDDTYRSFPEASLLRYSPIASNQRTPQQAASIAPSSLGTSFPFPSPSITTRRNVYSPYSPLAGGGATNRRSSSSGVGDPDPDDRSINSFNILSTTFNRSSAADRFFFESSELSGTPTAASGGLDDHPYSRRSLERIFTEEDADTDDERDDIPDGEFTANRWSGGVDEARAPSHASDSWRSGIGRGRDSAITRGGSENLNARIIPPPREPFSLHWRGAAHWRSSTPRTSTPSSSDDSEGEEDMRRGGRGTTTYPHEVHDASRRGSFSAYADSALMNTLASVRHELSINSALIASIDERRFETPRARIPDLERVSVGDSRRASVDHPELGALSAPGRHPPPGHIGERGPFTEHVTVTDLNHLRSTSGRDSRNLSLRMPVQRSPNSPLVLLDHQSSPVLPGIAPGGSAHPLTSNAHLVADRNNNNTGGGAVAAVQRNVGNSARASVIMGRGQRRNVHFSDATVSSNGVGQGGQGNVSSAGGVIVDIAGIGRGQRITSNSCGTAVQTESIGRGQRIVTDPSGGPVNSDGAGRGQQVVSDSSRGAAVQVHRVGRGRIIGDSSEGSAVNLVGAGRGRTVIGDSSMTAVNSVGISCEIPSSDLNKTQGTTNTASRSVAMETADTSNVDARNDTKRAAQPAKQNNSSTANHGNKSQSKPGGANNLSKHSTSQNPPSGGPVIVPIFDRLSLAKYTQSSHNEKEGGTNAQIKLPSGRTMGARRKPASEAGVEARSSKSLGENTVGLSKGRVNTSPRTAPVPVRQQLVPIAAPRGAAGGLQAPGGSGVLASSKDVKASSSSTALLRPRRRSEIAAELMSSQRRSTQRK